MKAIRPLHLRAHRPQLTAASPKICRTSSTTFATLAPARPSLRAVSHPAALLLQLSGITLGSMLIPVIQARRTMANQINSDTSDSLAETTKPEPSAMTMRGHRKPVDPPPQPSPTPRQLVRLAGQLRSQLSLPTFPFDAVFTLRQLHMVTQVPHLSLPAPPTPFLRLPTPHTLYPEKWIWRLPATTAVNAILRRLHDPACDERSRQSLLPIVIVLANHALHWDTLIWTAVLYSRGQSNALEWERLLARVQGQAGGKGLDEEIGVMVRLDPRERITTADSALPAWEQELQDRESARWDEAQDPSAGLGDSVYSTGRRADRRRRTQLDPVTGRTVSSTLTADTHALEAIPLTPEATPAALPLHPLSSLPPPTLEILFLYLARQPERSLEATSQALALSLAMGNLDHPRSTRMLYHTFYMALDNRRPDLAARAWVAYLAETQRSGKGRRQLEECFSALRKTLRDPGKRYSAVPGRAAMSSVATLARALDRQWTQNKNSGSSSAPLMNEMMDLIATFPIAPFARDFEIGTERRRVARIHSKVSRMTREVFRRIIEDVIRRPVYLGPLKVVVGTEPHTGEYSATQRLPLDVIGYNILISYALRQFHSSEIALRLLESMRASGLTPSTATHNILLGLIAQSGKEAAALVQKNAPNAHAFPNLIKYLTSRNDFDTIERIVFTLLPELNLKTSASDEIRPPSDGNSPFISDPLPTQSEGLPASSQPPAGRSPRLYVALLSALVAAGRVGLAERVFRSARWAAELSRDSVESAEAAADSSNRRDKAWTLPPQAFVLMLTLYARQVERGRALERQAAATGESSSRELVAGWGRHAVRVFLLNERRAELDERLGEDSMSRMRVARPPRIDQVGAEQPFLRREAAPIVAAWELEGGSKAPELDSLSRAMKSSDGRRALKILFPDRSLEGEDDGLGDLDSVYMRRRASKSSLLEHRAIRGESSRARRRA